MIFDDVIKELAEVHERVEILIDRIDETQLKRSESHCSEDMMHDLSLIHDKTYRYKAWRDANER